MLTQLSERLARLYVGWSLFLGAYAPLAIVFAMRLLAKSRPVKAEACVVIAVLLALNLFLLLRYARTAPQDYVADEVESGTGELAAYVATYILPFVMVGDVTNWDLIAYGTVLGCIGIVSIRGEALHLNPLLALRGYRLYTITTPKRRRWLVLSLNRIHKGDRLEASTIAHRLLLVIRNRSAHERTGSD
jgi:hypothetical protein